MKSHSSKVAVPGKKLVLFVDLDNVWVLNSPYGEYDAALALRGSDAGKVDQSFDSTDTWGRLVSPRAARLLGQIQSEFHPRYVLTTSWLWLMDDAALKEAPELSGLDFVVSSLHQDMSTPKGGKPGSRWSEISNWLDAHNDFRASWVVLDDSLSGTGLDAALPSEFRPLLVLCKPTVGLTEVEYDRLRKAFKLRLGTLA